ncbi:MAG: signal peptidase I [Candidatus Heimdallarchaeota archaeon]
MPTNLSQKAEKISKKKSKTTWRKDIIEIGFFIIVAVVLVLTFNQILGVFLHTSSPLVVVTSESMEPSYWGSNREDFGGENDIRKDMLIVRGVDPSTIKVGDSIVFNYINHTEDVDVPIVHRVTRVYQDGTGDYWFTTKGDNYITNDEFIQFIRIDELNIHEDRVVGKIVGRIPYLGGIYGYFQSSGGRTVLMVVVGVVFLLSIVLSMTGKDEEDNESDVFTEETEIKEITTKKADETNVEKTILDSLKDFYKKIVKKKHFVIPGFVLGLVILVPIVDTLDANWGTHLGIVDLDYMKSDSYDVTGGEHWFVFTEVTVNNPGHWHQRFQSFTLTITNQTSGEVLGEGGWTLVYNFEGQKTMSIGAWVEDGLLLDGGEYTITATAHLDNKFGKTWDDVKTINFTFTIP